MENINFKELGKFGKEFQVKNYKRVYSYRDLPLNGKPEIVFWGKSNVGKSSLINTILNYKINKVSKNTGCTRWIGFLEFENFNIIDLPGYSFAKISLGRKTFIEKMFLQYIKSNRTSCVFLLIDSSKDISEIDLEVRNLFKCHLSFIFTKADKFTLNQEFQVSIKSGIGIISLRQMILDIALNSKKELNLKF